MRPRAGGTRLNGAGAQIGKCALLPGEAAEAARYTVALPTVARAVA
ncbi:hypothetical protein [Hymenobacter lapidarius]|nr:hypothetical protein [Hymenobacter lapidarius]